MPTTKLIGRVFPGACRRVKLSPEPQAFVWIGADGDLSRMICLDRCASRAHSAG